MANTSFHSICRWTFNAGKGGFVPSDMRPRWKELTTASIVKLIDKEIRPRIPANIVLGVELHYDSEIDDATATSVSRTINDCGMYLAMITPGAHSHFAYGGIGSLDKKERTEAQDLGRRTVDLAYGKMRKCWHPTATPTFVLWNGSFGYDLATIGVRQMYQGLKESVAALCRHEESAGGELYIGFEPKPNEGHPAMLIPTVASALLFWCRLQEEFGITKEKKGVNKEFGHSEMIGLDHIYDTVEEIDNNALVHMHLNSQGYNDGIVLGGPGKYDIDHGTRINGMNIAIAGLCAQAGYKRWKGHDMQPRAYDNEAQAIDRVVRSVLSWEACEKAAAKLDNVKLLAALAQRKTAVAEDMMRDAVVFAQTAFNKMYKG